MIDLSNKVAIVTGASRGIGRACAERLAACGARVVVNFATSREQAAQVVQDITSRGAYAVAVQADVSQRDDAHALVDFAAERFGGVDIVVSNAAAGGFRPLAELSPASWDTVMQTNAAPLVWLTQAAATHLSASEESGKVIAVSSHGSIRGLPNYGVIGASKAALESLVRHLAVEFGNRGINFNAVLPGIVATNAIKTMPGASRILEAAGERMFSPQDALTPEHVAGVVSFLASPLADMIQGQTIVVDGGVTIGM